ncbi:MAG: hypothetical protein R2744_02250 [Bacteroidales bacterium]
MKEELTPLFLIVAVLLLFYIILRALNRKSRQRLTRIGFGRRR